VLDVNCGIKMTIKDYIAAAKIVKDLRVENSAIAKSPFLIEMEEAFVSFFKADNVHFDEKKFIAACRK
jgi:hypothetical protein